MIKDTSLFSSLDIVVENNIYVVDDFALDIAIHGYVACQRGQTINMFHVPSLSVNLLLVSQPTQTGKIVEFYPDHFFTKDLRKHRSIITVESLDPKDQMYKFCDLPRPESKSTTLIA